MTMERLFEGESENVEYKVARPKDSKKYLKTVVAFANSAGGVLVFGADDKTHEVIGIPSDEIFSEMDAIANAIGDGCAPQIVPDIAVQGVNDKALIVVRIAGGMQRPYYVKALGQEEGTFVRVGATSRPVERYSLRELLLDGSGRSLDGLVLQDQVVSDAEAAAFCQELTDYARSRARTEDDAARIRQLTKSQLISWGLLVEQDGKLRPTWGYKLLLGEPGPQMMSGVQCAVFKGSTRAVFVDRKFYDGPLYRQIDDAYEFVLRSIRMGAAIEGVQRQDVYELPIGTVREAISNAVCHRSYFQPSYVQVALYDDRLEITSPGMLSRDITIEKMRQGLSKVRNRGIASAFAYLGIIEAWGSGVPRMFEDCEAYGLAEPELVASASDFRVNFYRQGHASGEQRQSGRPEDQKTKRMPKSAGQCRRVPDNAEECRNMPEGGEANRQHQQILRLFDDHTQIASTQVEALLGVKGRRARAILGDMVKQGLILKIGNTSDTYYVLAPEGER